MDFLPTLGALAALLALAVFVWIARRARRVAARQLADADAALIAAHAALCRAREAAQTAYARGHEDGLGLGRAAADREVARLTEKVCRLQGELRDIDEAQQALLEAAPRRGARVA